MQGEYDAILSGKAVGQVKVTKEGLYYRFVCSCRLSGEVCRLRVRCADNEIDLGTLIPDGPAFGLNTKMPAKRFSGEVPVFLVVPNKPLLAGKFVPIYPEEPFAYIERLKTAHLAREGNQIGIVLEEAAGT